MVSTMPECDRCGRSGETLVLERRLDEMMVCDRCQDTLRDQADSREQSQHDLEDFGDSD